MARNTKNTAAKVAIAGLAVGFGAAAFAPAASAAPYSDWERLAECESGGNWHINNGNGYYGGLQFSPSTWTGFGGGEFAPTADRATKDQQIWVAEKVLASQGWNAWPACSQRLGLSSGPTERPKPVNGVTPSTGPNNAAAGINLTDPASIQRVIDRMSRAATAGDLQAIMNEVQGVANAAGMPVPAEITNFFNIAINGYGGTPQVPAMPAMPQLPAMGFDTPQVPAMPAIPGLPF
ncbi:resuscitation-promoting factor Rpf1 domain-containing protein [Corynebacterium sp. H113]|uniref:resuscitation-promoting factor Rpf1 domain-containing protein n=1 Tax=Corynebacterium sp. H113 TaxID=3133419 RepID=UPI003094D02C